MNCPYYDIFATGSFEMGFVMNVISASRRTDIPAFYGDWFRERIEKGFATYKNPFGCQVYTISLLPSDVTAIVFWSKNPELFLPQLHWLYQQTYRFYFQFTINAYSSLLEPNVPPTDKAIETFKILSEKYGAEFVQWRFDPIIISNITNEELILEKFDYLSHRLCGYTKRCYFSFVCMYSKVSRNMNKLSEQHKIQFLHFSNDEKIILANRLSAIAKSCGITMFTCCGDYLINDGIKKGHCVDAEIIYKLVPEKSINLKLNPTRKECGCFKSIDIGSYNTCSHKCIYCYANV